MTSFRKNKITYTLKISPTLGVIEIWRAYAHCSFLISRALYTIDVILKTEKILFGMQKALNTLYAIETI